jgi:hypothetical protein
MKNTEQKKADKMKSKCFLLWLIVASFLFTPFSMVTASTTRTLTGPTEVQGVPCQGKLELDRNGKIEMCGLSRDDTISGNPLPTGTKVFFDGSGVISRCILWGDAASYGQILPASTSVFFTRQGQMMGFWLPKDTFIQGHLIQAIHDGIGNSLHPNGKLRESGWHVMKRSTACRVRPA